MSSNGGTATKQAPSQAELERRVDAAQLAASRALADANERNGVRAAARTRRRAKIAKAINRLVRR